MMKSSLDRTYLTAISRTDLSAPMRKLKDKGMLLGRVLDYGCGRGQDAHRLGIDRYDPHFFPTPPEGPYDVVTCNYVLNVIEDPKGRADVIDRINSLLAPDGVAYLTVRRDVREDTATSRGTWQSGNIVVEEGQSIWRNGKFETYAMKKRKRPLTSGAKHG